jgi:hypothetical protein
MPDLYDVELKLPDEIYLKRDKDIQARPRNDVKIKNIYIEKGNGIFTELESGPELKGHAKVSHVRAIAAVKKAILSFVRVLKDAPYLIPFAWLARKTLLKNLARFSNSVLRDYYYKPQFYIKSAQEIYYAGMEILTNGRIYTEDWDTIGETNWNLLMFATMTWDSESAYRYRGQYALGEIDRDELSKNPRREIQRVIDILIIREKEQSMKDKWIALRKITPFLPCKKIAEFIFKLDLDRMKMDDGDLYWALRSDDFDYLSN